MCRRNRKQKKNRGQKRRSVPGGTGASELPLAGESLQLTMHGISLIYPTVTAVRPALMPVNRHALVLYMPAHELMIFEAHVQIPGMRDVAHAFVAHSEVGCMPATKGPSSVTKVMLGHAGQQGLDQGLLDG